MISETETCLTSLKQNKKGGLPVQMIGWLALLCGSLPADVCFFVFVGLKSFFWTTILILFTDHDNTFKLEALIRFIVVLSFYGCYEKPHLYLIFSTCKLSPWKRFSSLFFGMNV